MSYQKDRDEFVAVIVEEISGKPSPVIAIGEGCKLARLILRNAATIQRLAVEDCNRQISDGERKQRADAESRIVTACDQCGTNSRRIKPTFNGDPRGCCVKLLLPSGRWNSWGGAAAGYCVPVR